MESTPSAHPALELRRIMSLDSPRVNLGPKFDELIIKKEIHDDEAPLSINHAAGKKKQIEMFLSISQRLGFLAHCTLCTSRPGDSQLFIFDNPDRGSHLRSLLGTGPQCDLTFCPVCRSALTRMFHLKEAVGEIEAKIRTVVKLRRQSQENQWTPGIGNADGAKSTKESFSTLFLRLRQLISLDSPRVVLRRQPPLIKKETHTIITFDLSQRPTPSPAGASQAVKWEGESSSNYLFHCSLCTRHHHHHYHWDEEELSVFSSPDPNRERHLRSLLLPGGTIREDEESGVLFFCSVCRPAVARLFRLREKVEEIEARIRTVLILRGPAEPGTHSKVESPHDDVCQIDHDNNNSLTIGKVSQTKQHQRPSQIKKAIVKAKKKVVGTQGPGNVTGEAGSLIHAAVRYMGDHLTGHNQATGRSVLKNESKSEEAKSIPEYTDDSTVVVVEITGHRSRRNLRHDCRHCDQVFHNKRKYASHMKGVHNVNSPQRKRKTCSICKKGFNNIECYKAHSHPDPDGNPSKVVYTFYICGKKLGGRADYLRDHICQVHLKTSHGLCHKCGKVLKTVRNLRRHFKICSVPQEELTKCHCGKVFATCAQRRNHERVVHKELSSLKCYFCSTISSYPYHLAVHTRIHTREHPFSCPKCGKDFAHGTNLKVQMDTDCGSNEEKKEEFRRAKLVKDRRRWAKLLHHCHICDRKFGEKISLKLHQEKEHVTEIII